MPAKSKIRQRAKASKSQRRAPLPAPPANVDLHADDTPQVVRREPVVGMPLTDAPRPRSMDATERAIAKEDARIIAKASARALRRGLH